MNDVESFIAALRARVPGVDVKLDAPTNPSAPWWLDVQSGAHAAVIEWRRGHGFGVSTPRFDALGEGSDEVFIDADGAARRVVQLLEGEVTGAVAGPSARSRPSPVASGSPVTQAQPTEPDSSAILAASATQAVD